MEKAKRSELKTRDYLRRVRGYELIGSWCTVVIFVLTAVLFTNAYYNITDTRATGLLIETAIAACALLWGFIYFRARYHMKLGLDRTFRLTTVADCGMLFYLIIATISAFASKYQSVVYFGYESRFDGLFTQYAYGFLYFCASRTYRFSDWHGKVFASVVYAFALVGLLQFFGVDVFGLYPTGESLYTCSFMSTFGNINIVSTVSGIMTLFFGIMFICSDKQLWWYFGAACAAFLTQAIALSDSGWVNIAAGLLLMLPFLFTGRKRILRYALLICAFGVLGCFHDVVYTAFISGNVLGATANSYETTLGWKWLLVSLMGGILFALAYYPGKKLKIPAKRALALLCAGVLVIAAAGVGVIEIAGREGEGKLYQAREMLHGRMEDSFMSSRGYYWRTLYPLVWDNPLIGAGPDTVGVRHLEVYGDDAANTIHQLVDKAHNEYLQYALCEGLLGLAGYLTLVVGAIVLWLRRGRWKDGNPAYICAAGGAVAGYLCQAFFNLSVPISAPYFFIFLGMMTSREGLDTAD